MFNFMVANMEEQEQWRDIKGYENLYQISNFGRIKSSERYDSMGRKVTEKIRKQKLNNRGYSQICLNKNGNKKYFLVHRLVAEAFILNPNNLPQVNHIDENNHNNSASNLEWCNNDYNAHYGGRIERCAIKHRKPVETIINGKNILFKSHTEAEETLNLRRGAVSASIRDNKSVKGFYFKTVIPEVE